MKKLLSVLALTAATFGVQAATITVTPSGNADLKDLDHSTAVSWGFSLAGLQLGGYKITSATVTIKNINDWQVEANDHLYVDLLDNPYKKDASGQIYYSDKDDGASDYFTDGSYAAVLKKNKLTAGAVTKLFTYQDNTKQTRQNGKWVDVTSETISYSFTSSQLETLTAYLKTSFNSANQFNVGLSFDADCHYYNDGICFSVTTVYVPETTSTLGLLGLGALGLVGLRRFSRRF